MTNTAKELVLKALANEKWVLRTAEGIATETGLAIKEVLQILEQHPLIRQSRFLIDDGKPCFSLRSRPPKFRETIAALQQALAWQFGF